MERYLEVPFTKEAAAQLKAHGAMAALLKDALKPNLVQTIGGTPAIVHCGPFANIAHGCNSVQATKLAMTLADYTVTEAGFGADLGAEKFLDVKCRVASLCPDAVVIVATVRALKLNGGADKNNLRTEDLEALREGLPNLERHIRNISQVYRLPCVVAINRFTTDTDAEIELVKRCANKCGVDAVAVDVWGKGGKGATELADEVVQLCEQPNHFTFAYEDSDSIEDKITKVATKIYGARDVYFTDKAKESIEALRNIAKEYPVVIAKTQYSFSDNPKLLGAPSDFTLTVRDVEIRNGAGFVVALAGNMLLMPGLPGTPNSEGMTIDSDGLINGLY